MSKADLKNPTPNIRVRIFGILLQDKQLDDLNSIVDRKKANRGGMDDPSQSRDSVFERIALLVNNEDLQVSHPPGWDDAVERKGGGCSDAMTALWEDLNPNDEVQINITRTGDEVRLIYMNTMKLYNAAMNKWTQGTGGGGGAPENYCDFDSREEDKFANYDIQYGVLLTWIFMWDKYKGEPLQGGADLLPNGFEAGENSGYGRKPVRNKAGKSLTDLTEKLMANTAAGVDRMTSVIEKAMQAELPPLRSWYDLIEREKLVILNNEDDEDIDRARKRIKTFQKQISRRIDEFN
jgi:hypothetical protein